MWGTCLDKMILMCSCPRSRNGTVPPARTRDIARKSECQPFGDGQHVWCQCSSASLPPPVWRWSEALTLWLFNIAMENGPFIDDFPIKTSIKGFSMAMLNNQMVFQNYMKRKNILSLANPWQSYAKLALGHNFLRLRLLIDFQCANLGTKSWHYGPEKL